MSERESLVCLEIVTSILNSLLLILEIYSTLIVLILTKEERRSVFKAGFETSIYKLV